jgi:hypothetical protein
MSVAFGVRRLAFERIESVFTTLFYNVIIFQ